MVCTEILWKRKLYRNRGYICAILIYLHIRRHIYPYQQMKNQDVCALLLQEACHLLCGKRGSLYNRVSLFLLAHITS